MNYDNIAFESWCDSVMIAQEGKVKILPRISLKEAKKASSAEEVYKLTMKNTALIKLEGSVKDEILPKVKAAYIKYAAGLVGTAAAGAAIGYGASAVVGKIAYHSIMNAKTLAGALKAMSIAKKVVPVASVALGAPAAGAVGVGAGIGIKNWTKNLASYSVYTNGKDVYLKALGLKVAEDDKD